MLGFAPTTPSDPELPTGDACFSVRLCSPDAYDPNRGPHMADTNDQRTPDLRNAKCFLARSSSPNSDPFSDMARTVCAYRYDGHIYVAPLLGPNMFESLGKHETGQEPEQWLLQNGYEDVRSHPRRPGEFFPRMWRPGWCPSSSELRAARPGTPGRAAAAAWRRGLRPPRERGEGRLEHQGNNPTAPGYRRSPRKIPKAVAAARIRCWAALRFVDGLHFASR